MLINASEWSRFRFQNWYSRFAFCVEIIVECDQLFLMNLLFWCCIAHLISFFCVFNYSDRFLFKLNLKNGERRREDHRALHSEKMVFQLFSCCLCNGWLVSWGNCLKLSSVSWFFCVVMVIGSARQQTDWSHQRIMLQFSLTLVILMLMVSTLANSPPLLSADLSVLRFVNFISTIVFTKFMIVYVYWHFDWICRETQTVAWTGSGRRRRSKPNNSERQCHKALPPLVCFLRFSFY